ncbi:hypothetical protein [Streptacidiphilus fuscans]|uniref:Uncharacterized protein n=1 Tax=Streptacidiphilus fuscans TaxID=2789292 RepID=A0A931BCP2_9ACTN|nr:hypothetical protein [Streptacidiphilus fuscans]MBF9071783.1 hypothetical protein [Streptacidiphilus fuscans]
MRIADTADGRITAEGGDPQAHALLRHAGFVPHPDGSLRQILPDHLSRAAQLRTVRAAASLLDAAGHEVSLELDTSPRLLEPAPVERAAEPVRGLLPALRATFEEALDRAAAESGTAGALGPDARERLVELMARQAAAFVAPEEVPALFAVLARLQVPRIARHLPPPAPAAEQVRGRSGRQR